KKKSKRAEEDDEEEEGEEEAAGNHKCYTNNMKHGLTVTDKNRTFRLSSNDNYKIIGNKKSILNNKQYIKTNYNDSNKLVRNDNMLLSTLRVVEHISTMDIVKLLLDIGLNINVIKKMNKNEQIKKLKKFIINGKVKHENKIIYITMIKKIILEQFKNLHNPIYLKYNNNILYLNDKSKLLENLKKGGSTTVSINKQNSINNKIYSLTHETNIGTTMNHLRDKKKKEVEKNRANFIKNFFQESSTDENISSSSSFSSSSSSSDASVCSVCLRSSQSSPNKSFTICENEKCKNRNEKNNYERKNNRKYTGKGKEREKERTLSDEVDEEAEEKKHLEIIREIQTKDCNVGDHEDNYRLIHCLKWTRIYIRKNDNTVKILDLEQLGSNDDNTNVNGTSNMNLMYVNNEKTKSPFQCDNRINSYSSISNKNIDNTKTSEDLDHVSGIRNGNNIFFEKLEKKKMLSKNSFKEIEKYIIDENSHI
ncbi:bromodomain protein, putative, partial [Hepatocystis sp. ex Piliocolobus tephrosceles]